MSESKIISVTGTGKKCTVKLDISSLDRKFNSELKHVDGFRVDGKLYGYVVTDTTIIVRDVDEKVTTRISSILTQMIEAYSNTTKI